MLHGIALSGRMFNNYINSKEFSQQHLVKYLLPHAKTHSLMLPQETMKLWHRLFQNTKILD